VQIRRELIDLYRRYKKRIDRPGESAADAQVSTYDPSRLEDCAEFHRQVEALPEQEREVFGLLWYQGLKQAEAAAVLNVSVREVKSRWQSARLLLYQALKGEPPAC
jgi:RNA polymerase sigma factor (sigma-70 family)